jgi:hypothetical protein
VDLQIPRLGFMEDLADVVYRTLDGPGPPEGSDASISIGAGPGSSRSFAHGGSSKTGDPVTAWSGGLVVASGDWDPAAATTPGSSAGPGTLTHWQRSSRAHVARVGPATRLPAPFSRLLR